MVEADAAQSDPCDEALVAGGDHGRQLTVEQFAIDVGRGAGIVAPVDAKVHRGKLVDLEGAQVLLDARAQFVGLLGGEPRAVVVATCADLADQREVRRIRVQRFADQLVGDVRAVELGGVDVVDAELDGALQHRDRLVVIARRPEDAGPGQLHGAEADAMNGERAEREGLHGAW